MSDPKACLNRTYYPVSLRAVFEWQVEVANIIRRSNLSCMSRSVLDGIAGLGTAQIAHSQILHFRSGHI